ncbi:ABC-type multidrug transport system, ATPase and permease component [Xenococcus sp. PCC 7305]|uniref:ABC transporter ATP-binding protein n=1 Tax=Xenococcus sp. PCC 7305 TaxID=102125 RepID=UPI0002ACAFC7|nr:ABC transporter ATP-binding protein [Xenococcus sp. PCC 7305]ELS03713.1 ABC-type multidrug transport system, ATPase and permease component [Xenococcus sp. PCC 7305]
MINEKRLSSIRRILKHFLPQIRPQINLILLSFVALIGETVFRLLEPWPLKFIFDEIIYKGFQVESLKVPFLDNLNSFGLLSLLAVGLVAIAVLRGTMAYLSTTGMAVAATRIMSEVRANLYAHLQSLSLSFHHKAKTGDLITRVTYDIERLREVTVVAALPLLTNVLTMLGMLGVMIWLNLQLALIAIAIFPLFLLTTTAMSRRIHKVAKKQRQREGVMAANAAEAMGAIKVVQALSLQSMLEKSFAKQNKKSLKESAETQRLRAGQERTVEVLVAIATAIVLWRGVQLVITHAITPGDLLVFITYLKVAFKPMRQLAKYTGQIAKAIASGERVIDLLEIVPEVRDSRWSYAAPLFQGMIEFRDVSFAYENQANTLNNISFKAFPGQKIALVGASGGGKSTLVSLLLRLYDPLEGQVVIDGHNLREYTLDSLRRQISIVLQDSILFAASIRDNIAYGCVNATEEEILMAAQLANAHDFILDLPDGYDTVVGERGATLSGGQKQRIAIARAAIRKAPIVILDEPTVGLDNRSERIVTEALERLTYNSTTFLITHDLRTAKNADQIFYLEGGRILEQGTHKQLMNIGKHYATLYHLQQTVHVN